MRGRIGNETKFEEAHHAGRPRPCRQGGTPVENAGGAQARKMPPGAARSGRECGERARPCPYAAGRFRGLYGDFGVLLAIAGVFKSRPLATIRRGLTAVSLSPRSPEMAESWPRRPAVPAYRI